MTVCLLGSEIRLSGVDRTSQVNSFQFGISAAEADTTTFGSKGTRTRKGTRRDWQASLGGFYDTAIDDLVNVGGEQDVLLAPDPSGASLVNAAGDPAVFGRGFLAGFDFGGAESDLAGTSLRIAGTAGAGGCARGKLVAVTAGAVTNEVSAIQQLYGADGSNARLLMAIFALTPGGAGGNIDVTVSTDDGVGFGSPTTRHATGPVATSGFEYSTLVDLGDCGGDNYVRTEVDADVAVTELLVAVGVYTVAS